MVKFLNEPFGDLLRPNINVGLYGDIHLRAGGLEVSPQSGKTVQRLSNGVQSRDRNVKRLLLLGLLDNLIDAGTQLKVSAAQSFFRWQQCNGGTPTGRFLLDLVCRCELEAVGPMPMHARDAQTMIARNLCRRLAGCKPAVDLGTLEMLTCVALSHAVYSKPQNLLNGKGEVKFSGKDAVNACAGLAADACGPGRCQFVAVR